MELEAQGMAPEVIQSQEPDQTPELAQKQDRMRRVLFWVGVTVLVCAMLLQLAVNLNVTVYSDDYWYGTFFRGGWQGFWEQTVSHYQNTNGRVLVHILIPILLLADTKLFAVISPLLTAGIFLFALRSQNPKLGRGALLLGAGLSLLTVLGSEIQYLRMSLYWLSAFFNYAFPLLFPLAALWGMDRFVSGRQKAAGFVGLCLCCLLAGASTEQCGLAALIMVWGRWLQLRRRTERPRRLLLCPLLVSLGYLTVLLAPGSHARMERGIAGGFFSFLEPSVFAGRFFDVMSYLCSFWFWNLLFAAFCLLPALLWWTDRTLPKPLLAGIPVSALVLLLAALGLEGPLAVLTVAYTVYVAVFLLLRPAYQVTGLLILGAGASVMMLLITTLYYARTFFPCILLVIAICWSLLLRLLERLPLSASGAVCGALALVFLIRYVPIYQGYAANHMVVEENLRAIETLQPGETLELSIDLDADYRFTMFFEGSYFLTNFRQYYRIPAECPIRFTSQEWDLSDVEVNGAKSEFPALEKDGELLYPIFFVISNLGETCQFDWSRLTYTITREGRTYTLADDGQLWEHLPDGSTTLADGSCELVMPFSYTYTLLYISAGDLERCFGITADYDAARDCYVFGQG